MTRTPVPAGNAADDGSTRTFWCRRGPGLRTMTGFCVRINLPAEPLTTKSCDDPLPYTQSISVCVDDTTECHDRHISEHTVDYEYRHRDGLFPKAEF